MPNFKFIATEARSFPQFGDFEPGQTYELDSNPDPNFFQGVGVKAKPQTPADAAEGD